MNEMNIEKAIEILELHNKWRRDNDGEYEMVEPKELGKAIDSVVSEFKNLHLQRVSHCACSPDETTGTTAVQCCNICGKPTEKFWRCG